MFEFFRSLFSWIFSSPPDQPAGRAARKQPKPHRVGGRKGYHRQKPGGGTVRVKPYVRPKPAAKKGKG